MYQVPDLKDKNEENQNIINNVLNSVLEEFDNKYLNLNENKKANSPEKINVNEGKENNELNNNENNASNINSIKNTSTHNNGLENKLSQGNTSLKISKSGVILPVMITPLNKFNKRYNETKKRLSLSNLDTHFLNKWTQFLSEYKFNNHSPNSNLYS